MFLDINLLNGRLYHVCKQNNIVQGVAQRYIVSTMQMQVAAQARVPTTKWSLGFKPCARLPIYLTLWYLHSIHSRVWVASDLRSFGIHTKTTKPWLFPNKHKIAKLLPNYKKSEEKDMKSYRPVLVLPILAKTTEFVLYPQLMNPLEPYNLLDPSNMSFEQQCDIVETTVIEFI